MRASNRSERRAQIRPVLKRAQTELLAKKNVVSCGIGNKMTGGQDTGELCLVVGVSEKVAAARLSPQDLVPRDIGGIETDVVETKTFFAQPKKVTKTRKATGKKPATTRKATTRKTAKKVVRKKKSAAPKDVATQRTSRHRPAPGGVSIGHVNITAGTLGCLVKRGEDVLILSNNHVLANSNAAIVGDPIIQPGAADGGSVTNDHIASLEDFVPVSFDGDGGLPPGFPPDCPVAKFVATVVNSLAKLTGSNHRVEAFKTKPQAVNLVDAAIAKPLNPADVVPEILEIGVPKGTAEVVVGNVVKKSGRTTELTEDFVVQTDVTVQVQYGPGQIAVFEDQIMAGPMSAGGDSGSLVLNQEDEAVGLLFAGSEQFTICNPIQAVLDGLGIELVTTAPSPPIIL